MEKTVNRLPDEVGKKYNVLKGHPYRFVHPNVGQVDLNRITLKTADNLVKRGVKCLVPAKTKKKE